MIVFRWPHDDALRACDESLERLGLEYIDVYLIHWPVPDHGQYVEAWKALVRLKQEGLPHRLVVVGGRGWRFAPIQRLVDELGLTGDVVFTGYVPAEELPPLYTSLS